MYYYALYKNDFIIINIIINCFIMTICHHDHEHH